MAVTGNCDTPVVAARTEAVGINISDKVVSQGGLDVAGVAWSGEERIFDAVSQSLAARLSERDKSRPLIIISHCPALGTLDEAEPGLHAGSQAISDLVRSAKPVALLSGHVHGARGLVRSGGTVFVNAGPAMDGHAALVTYEKGRLDAVLL